MDGSLQLLVQLTTILLVVRVVGWACRKLGQSQVVGELVAGLLLGPSLLGWLIPGLYESLFPPASLAILAALSQVGIVLFMFLMGLAVRPDELRRTGVAVLAIAGTGILVPFTLGLGLAMFVSAVQPLGSDAGLDFALFLGVTMSVTAFPVLARILAESGLTSTPLGNIALACAAVDDVTAWSALALLVMAVRADNSEPDAGQMLLGAFGLVAALILVRPLLAHVLRLGRSEYLSHDGLALALLLALGAATVTHKLGLHPIFGAFIAGAVFPRDTPLVRQLRTRIEDLSIVLFVPLFFTYTGLRTNVVLVLQPSVLAFGALVVVTATLGKCWATAVMARYVGMPWRDSLALGALLNTRGLMQILVLNVGVEAGIITPTTFSVLVLASLVMTLATTPMVRALRSRPVPSEQPDLRWARRIFQQ